MKRKKKIYRLAAVFMILFILAGNVSVWAEECRSENSKAL